VHEPTTGTVTRVLALLRLLAQRRAWSGGELARRLGVTDRTVRRDVGRLRELGYAVEATSGPAGGYRLVPGAHLPPVVLDEEAAVAVAVALELAVGLGSTPEATAHASAAVAQVMPTALRRRVEALRTTTVGLLPEGPGIDPALLATLASCCRDGEHVRLTYTDRAGVVTGRHVVPHRLVLTGRRWYLVAHDEDRRAWRTLRVDRATDVRPTGLRSRPPDPPEAGRFVQESTGRAPYRYHARVVLEAPVATVRAQVPPTVAVVEPLPGPAGRERCELTTGSDSLDALAVHVAALGHPFEVLEPPELRERLPVLAARLAAAAGPTSSAGRGPSS
jgi:predicted DNA-binding transcriptional regulator YafY